MKATTTDLDEAYALNRLYNTIDLRIRTVLYALDAAEHEPAVLNSLRSLASIANMHAPLTSSMTNFWQQVSEVMNSEGFSPELHSLVRRFAASLEDSRG